MDWKQWLPLLFEDTCPRSYTWKIKVHNYVYSLGRCCMQHKIKIPSSAWFISVKTYMYCILFCLQLQVQWLHVLETIATVFAFPHLKFLSLLLGALFSVIASVESFSNLLSIGYSYILPVLLHHHLSPGMVYVILAGLGLIPVPLLRYVHAVLTCA